MRGAAPVASSTCESLFANLVKDRVDHVLHFQQPDDAL